ncbi:tripartite tricarboxylate transporter substrate-binding protein [Xylophilus sp. GOD-11R]|uniref:tripartite tricarboxylate transporter substrate-binding protein n=1 Tax=Xylophilus sp. GOD-11R TaxID=3089814 RepID=UPI00298C5119|nr:tripartite tricarboxylate transporter substrate-binding protein [Xylophilus sp. GOD-11R]WPB55826.1 tripartite tricarboxylate transporter substrate-binding protein [Xylophilus sp. GOD-11R]
MTMGHLDRRTVLAGLSAWAAPAAFAQAGFPSRAVQMIVPAAPGGPVSNVATLLQPHLARRWRQRVVLQYVPGNGTVTGVLAVARSPATGYHIGLATSALAINAALRSTMPYRTLDDLVPVSLLASFQYAIFANRREPIHHVGDLLAFARRRGGAVPYASPGIGTGANIAMEAFAYEAGFRVEHRPYNSTTPAEAAVRAGEVPLFVGGLTTTVEAAQNGPLQLVALMGGKTAIHADGVSWASDLVRGFEVTGHVGAIAPRAVPPAALQVLGADLAAVAKLPEMRAALTEIGMEPIGFFSPESEAHLRADIARWRLVGRAARIELN